MFKRRGATAEDEAEAAAANPSGKGRPTPSRKTAEAAAAQNKTGPKELQGPKGPEPTRYGDWERKGIASDF